MSEVTTKSEFEGADKACRDLRAGVKSRIIEKALTQLASKAATRGQLVKDGEARIDAAIQFLNGSDRDSDASRVTSAISTIADLSRELSALQTARTTDPKTAKILETWPRYITEFNAAAGNLREMKTWQFTLGNASKRCNDEERALDAFLGGYTDASGISAIEARGAQMLADMRTRFDGANAKDREIDTWNREAHRFPLEDAKWSTLSRSVRDTGDAMFALWQRALDQAQRSCGDLALGSGHPNIVATPRRLTGTTPPAAVHITKHDSTCTGVSADGFCTRDDQCLDGTCTNHRCEKCPSQADGRCHPPGLCAQRDYDSMTRVKDDECSKPFRSASYEPQTAKRRNKECTEQP